MATSARERIALIAALLLAACAAPAPPPATDRQAAPQREVQSRPVPPGDAVLARTDEFVVVVPRAGDTFALLAERYLGDARRAWWIADFNGLSRPEPGVDLAIPLKPSSLGSVDRQGARALVILCYHRFGTAAGKLTVTEETFSRQMALLAGEGYNVVPLREVPAILRGETPMPPKAVAITIDDGYNSVFEIAYPVLERRGFAATVFLYADFVGVPDGMTWAQMKALTASGLVDVQPHSKTHANLSLRLPGETDRAYAERVSREIEVPAGEIQRRLGGVIYAFAYPYGDANPTVIDAVRQRAIDLALTVTPGGNPFYAYPMLLRRTMVFGDDSLAEFRAKLDGRNGEP